jgi:nucleoid DNA-binding protein
MEPPADTSRHLTRPAEQHSMLQLLNGPLDEAMYAALYGQSPSVCSVNKSGALDSDFYQSSTPKSPNSQFLSPSSVCSIIERRPNSASAMRSNNDSAGPIPIAEELSNVTNADPSPVPGKRTRKYYVGDKEVTMDATDRSLDEEPQLVGTGAAILPVPAEKFIGPGKEYVILERGTNKKKPLLITRDNHQYIVDTKTPGTIYWRCVKWGKGIHDCKGRVNQRSNNELIYKEPHNHKAHEQAYLAKRAKEIAMSKVIESTDTCKQVANKAVEQAYTELEKTFDGDHKVSTAKLGTQLQRSRRKELGEREPKPGEHFHVDKDTYLNRGLKVEEVWVGSGSPGSRRHLIFYAQDFLAHLAAATSWYLDGTFKSCPRKLYLQLFTIHVYVQSEGQPETACKKQIPTIFILMQKREYIDYVAVLEVVKRLLVESCPSIRFGHRRFVLDFEMAAWKAIEQVFEVDRKKNVRGCHFHLNQALYRKMQQLSLATRYNRQAVPYQSLRELMGLAFLEPRYIPIAFQAWREELKDKSKKHQKLLGPLIAYFEKNWVLSRSKPPETWSVYNCGTRTNNSVESWHFVLNNRLGVGMKGYWHLIREIEKEVKLVRATMNQVALGKESERGRRQTAEMTAHLERMWRMWRQWKNDKHTLKLTGWIREVMLLEGLGHQKRTVVRDLRPEEVDQD